MSTAGSATRTRTLEWLDPVATAAAGAEMAGLEYLRALVAGELARPPISIVMNMVPVELEEGRAVFAGEPGEASSAVSGTNPIGVVHRGRRQATAEARLTAADTGKLLATGTSTLMIFA